MVMGNFLNEQQNCYKKFIHIGVVKNSIHIHPWPGTTSTILRVNFGAKKESILWLFGGCFKKRNPEEGFKLGPDSREK